MTNSTPNLADHIAGESAGQALSLDSYRLLGRTGLRVSPLALGTMTFGSDWGWGADRDETKAIFDAYVGRGGNFIDTANAYTNGTAEQARLDEVSAIELGFPHEALRRLASTR